MSKTLLIVLPLATMAFVLSVEARIPDEEQVAEAWEAIEGLMDANERLGAKFLRLAFHDCVSETCNGCVNLANPDNGGLDEPIEALESIYKPDGVDSDHSKAMSRADFWIIAALAGIERGIDTTNGDYAGGSVDDSPLVFVGGRKDCPTSPDNPPNIDDNLPSAHWGSQKVFNYFNSVFGLSQYETVALMGAHTLGAASEENVGFDGVWTGPSRSLFHFDGTYHHILLVHDYGWTFENFGTQANPKYQWHCEDLAKPEDEDRDCGFMLDSDIAMLVDLTTDANGKPTCTFFMLNDTTCGINQDNFVQMQRYDDATNNNSNNDFITDFSAAFTKVINRI